MKPIDAIIIPETEIKDGGWIRVPPIQIIKAYPAAEVEELVAETKEAEAVFRKIGLTKSADKLKAALKPFE